MKRSLGLLFLTAGLAVLAMPLRAQSASTSTLEELERKVDALSEEVERLKLGGGPSAQGAAGGLPVFLNKLSLGGYAEINAQTFARRNQKGDPGNLRSITDLQRFVLVAEYRFSDSISFKSEFEVEHGGTGQGSEARGEAGVEQAYVDFRQWDFLNFRAGHVLMPMGLINERHEPPTFHGVLRPSVETFIIPTTWHENGLGIFGDLGPVSYRSYVVAGLQAVAPPAGMGPTVDGFTGSNGIAGSSTEGSRSPIESKAWVSRADWTPVSGSLVGASIYVGQAGQNIVNSVVPVTLWEAHARGEYRGAELRALFAQGTIGDADVVNAGQLAQNPAFTDFVGRRQFGGYVEGAFDVLSLDARTTQYAAPFFRYERYDTQAQVPRGFVNNAANSRVEYTLGATYKPVQKVALKADYQWKRNQARTGVNQWNLGVGLMF